MTPADELTSVQGPVIDSQTGSYRQIFKSTSLVGGAQVANILIGIVRTKALAVLLGPAGMGLAGMFQSATGLVGTLTGFGIGQAGVRQIAEAVGTGDEARIARTIRTLRRIALTSGFLGMLLMLIFYRPLAVATFGNLNHAGGVALVSLTLLFSGITAGQTALLQGLRRLRDLAVCTVLGSVFGTMVSVLIVCFLRERGVALFLVMTAAFTMLPSWWFARKIRIAPIFLTWRQIADETRSLLKMGLAFMVSAVLNVGTTYIVRVIIMRDLGMAAVGLYTATWTLSSLYVGVVLGAMAADYFPKLTAVAKHNDSVNRLVNEQTEIGLLMAIPGILATLVLAPYVLRFFYSVAFMSATEIVRWQVLGVALRVVSWPLGFVLLAKGESRWFILTELTVAIVQVVFTVVCMRIWGMEGIGIAFFLVYVYYTILILRVVHRISGFSWTKGSRRLVGAGIIVCLLGLCVVRLLPILQATIMGLVLIFITTLLSLLLIKKLLRLNIIIFVYQKLRKGWFS